MSLQVTAANILGVPVVATEQVKTCAAEPTSAFCYTCTCIYNQFMNQSSFEHSLLIVCTVFKVLDFRK